MKLSIMSSTEEESEYVHQRLREYNAGFMHELEDYSFHVKENGAIIGGIVAGSLSDTLEVEFLFVEESHRGQGIGRGLLHHVEDLAREKGLNRILLNTYSFQAPDFYKGLGYREQLRAPAFDGYTQSWFIKEL